MKWYSNRGDPKSGQSLPIALYFEIAADDATAYQHGISCSVRGFPPTDSKITEMRAGIIRILQEGRFGPPGAAEVAKKVEIAAPSTGCSARSRMKARSWRLAAAFSPTGGLGRDQANSGR